MLRVLSSGVDTLHLSVRGTPDEEWIRRLGDAQGEARATGEDQVVSLTDPPHTFLMRPHGWRRYRLWMSSPSYEVMLGAADLFPFGFVQVHAAFLHALGIEGTVDDVRSLLARLFSDEPEITVSRIDLYVDQQGWTPTHATLPEFVCRAVQRRLFDHAVTHSNGRQLTGFVFGKGDIVARIYNKTAETTASGVTWHERIWKGRDPDDDVWRVEFQFRRGMLRRYGLHTLDDVIAARQRLWEYATTWLSLRERGAHHLQSRWKESPVWSALRAAEIGDPAAGELVARELELADQVRLLRGFVGYASALTAREPAPAGDLRIALARIAPLVQRYLMDRQTSFDEIVAAKRQRVLRLTAPEELPEAA